MTPSPEIHIVEDHPVTLKLLVKVVRDFGFTPIGHLGSVDALRKMIESPPRIVVLDWDMPELDGMELCRQLRTKLKGKARPYVIMLTGLSKTRRSLSLALDAGVDEFLSKPVDIHELWARLMQADKIVDELAEKKLNEVVVPFRAAV